MQTKVEKISPQSIEKAKDILLNGGVVAIPTETVYGLGAIGTDSNAVLKIFEIKGRPSDNPLIAHVHKDYDLEKLVKIEHSYVFELMKAFMPGPLTLVFNSKNVVCKEAVCGGQTLAVRMPSHKGCQELLRSVDAPIVAPSANISKHTSPVTAEHVYNDLNGKLELILDGGKCEGGIESTVLDVTEQTPRILRAGLVTKEMIQSVCGKCEIAQHKESDKVRSPGVKYKHYRPRCQTALYNKDQIDQAKEAYNQAEDKGQRVYIMCQTSLAKEFEGKNLLLLGDTGEQVASNLYDKLLEGENKADLIIAISPDREDGVFLGVMNRLRKSCG